MGIQGDKIVTITLALVKEIDSFNLLFLYVGNKKQIGFKINIKKIKTEHLLLWNISRNFNFKILDYPSILILIINRGYIHFYSFIRVLVDICFIY